MINISYFLVDKRIQAAQQLAEALRSNDPQQIRKALSEYQYNKAEGDDNLLKEGRKKLRQLEAKYGVYISCPQLFKALNGAWS